MPWDYNNGESESLRYKLNNEGFVIALDIAYLPHENGETLLHYFPQEICKLQYLQILRIRFHYPTIPYTKEDMEIYIPDCIQELKKLKYFWTNAKYSELLKPFLDSLVEFGPLYQEF